MESDNKSNNFGRFFLSDSSKKITNDKFKSKKYHNILNLLLLFILKNINRDLMRNFY